VPEPTPSKIIALARLEGEALGVEALSRIPIFQDVPAAMLEKYPGAVVLRRFKPGEVICREGDHGFTAFYLLKGRVEALISTPMAHAATHKSEAVKSGWGRLIRKFKSFLRRRETGKMAGPAEYVPIDAPVDLNLASPIAEMGPGDLFGEMTCLNNYPRSATVRALEEVEALEILKNILTLLQKRSKAFKERIDRSYRERTIINHLSRLPFLANVPPGVLEEVAGRAELISLDPGTVAVRQGDPADAVYLIRLGFVKVTQTRAGGDVVLGYLHRGQYFGAAGILGSGVRSATCSAFDHVQLVRIARADVEQLMQNYESVRRELEKDLVRVHTPVPQPLVPVQEFLDQGLLNANNLLLIDLEKCTRCDDCVRACADSHDGVTRLIREGLRFDNYLVATSCRSCADPLCMIGCPVGAIHRKESLEIQIEDWCIGCGLCSRQCPYGNINMHPFEVPGGGTRAEVRAKAVTCDLCHGLGEPSCVYACPHEAAIRVAPREFFADRLRGGA
jgi:CRP-like cAMP-binding protein/Fe-S-cluster-containing hydrogenase component 2